jgi:hypothetical protein
MTVFNLINLLSILLLTGVFAFIVGVCADGVATIVTANPLKRWSAFLRSSIRTLRLTFSVSLMICNNRSFSAPLGPVLGTGRPKLVTKRSSRRSGVGRFATNVYAMDKLPLILLLGTWQPVYEVSKAAAQKIQRELAESHMQGYSPVRNLAVVLGPTEMPPRVLEQARLVNTENLQKMSEL